MSNASLLWTVGEVVSSVSKPMFLNPCLKSTTCAGRVVESTQQAACFASELRTQQPRRQPGSMVETDSFGLPCAPAYTGTDRASLEQRNL